MPWKLLSRYPHRAGNWERLDEASPDSFPAPLESWESLLQRGSVSSQSYLLPAHHASLGICLGLKMWTPQSSSMLVSFVDRGMLQIAYVLLCICLFALFCFCQLDTRHSHLGTRKLSWENAPIDLTHRQACGVFSWIMIDIEGSSPLWPVLPLRRCSWVV